MVNPDNNDLFPDRNVVDIDQMPQGVESDTSDASDQPETTSDSILDNWNTKPARPSAYTEAQTARLREISRVSSMTKEELAAEMINMKPVGFINTEDTVESPVTAPQSVETEKPEVAPVSAPKASEMDTYIQTLQHLGVADTVSTNPIADPNRGLHAPMDNRDIVRSQYVEADQFQTPVVPMVGTKKSEPTSQPASTTEVTDADEDMMEMEMEMPDTTASDLEDKLTSTRDEFHAGVSEDLDGAETSVEVAEVAEAVTPVAAVEVQPEIVVPVTPIIEVPPVTTVPPVAPQPTATPAAPVAPVEPELPPVEDIPTIEQPVTDPVYTAVDVDAALEGLPESKQVLENLELDPIDQESTDLPEEIATDDAELTPRAALLGIASIHDSAIFGTDPVAVFDAEDMDILTDDSLPAMHVALSNATPEERLHYVAQTEPASLLETSRKLFGVNNPLHHRAEEGIEELQKAVMTPTYVREMRTAQDQMDNPGAKFNHSLLEKAFATHAEQHPDKPLRMSRPIRLTSKDKETALVVDDGFVDRAKLMEQLEPGQQTTVSSKNAVKIAMTFMQAIRRVHLYNSGFWVTIVAPNLVQLTKYYNTMITRSMEYGRIIGQLACLPAGVETRAALIDMFEGCVVESNLANWKEPGQLRKAISCLDMKVLAWAMASLIYPRGVDITYLCHNDHPGAHGNKCRFTETTRLDINSMRYNNWSLLNADAIYYVDSKEVRTLEDLKEYRKTHLKDNGTTMTISSDNDWNVTFVIPDLYTAEEKQRAYVADMIASINIADTKRAEEYARAKNFFAFAPYIDTITYRDQEVDKSFKFKEASALEQVLDSIQLLDGVNLPEKLFNYIGSRSVTHIAFAHSKCPNCGKHPYESVNHLSACDPEYAFFVWAAARIHQ